MITGPLGMRFGERALPRVETGEIAGYDLPTPSRVRRWFDLAPIIGDDLFLKLYTHGAAERNLDPLLGGALGNLFRWIAEEADRRGIEVHWATAWQMYQAVDALIEPAGAAKDRGGSVMFLQYFGFQQDPFGATPDPRCLYLSGTHREALASLEYGFLSNRGFTAMIAPPGMGKTTLLCRFLENARGAARTVFLFDIDAECEPREFVAYILRDIGITPAQTSSEMHEQLTEALAKENRAGRKFVVVIDEAQNLSDAVLERVRLLTNFETSRGKLMQVVLSGQPQLSDKLMQPFFGSTSPAHIDHLPPQAAVDRGDRRLH